MLALNTFRYKHCLFILQCMICNAQFIDQPVQFTAKKKNLKAETKLSIEKEKTPSNMNIVKVSKHVQNIHNL